MFLFDGSFKRAPLQNLGGTTVKTDRQTLIDKVHHERKKREEKREKELSSIKIQKFIRSCQERQRIKQRERINYEKYLQSNGLNDLRDLSYLLQRLLFFYELKDSDQLIFLCQFILKKTNISEFIEILLSQTSNNEHRWKYRIQKLCVTCLKQIFAATSSSPAIPMRMIETFTSFEAIKKNTRNCDDKSIVRFLKCLFSYMVDQNYFKNVRQMLCEKIPDNTYDEETIKPHSEMSRILLELMQRPLKLISALDIDEIFNFKILESFTVEIAQKEFSRTIKNFIMPSLSCDFPFVKFIMFLHRVHAQDGENRNRNLSMDEISQQIAGKHNIKFNGWLLHSVLKLDDKYLDEIIIQNLLSQYLIVIGSMIGNITKLPRLNQFSNSSGYTDDDTSADSESDRDDEDDPMQPQMERLVLREIIQQLNEQTRVCKIVKNIDGLLHMPEIVHSLCVVTHNLMIYNRSAISDYRLLDLLAFKPDFIRTLWYTLLTSKSQKNQMTISILSRGIQIPPRESAQVVPILASFCALFGRLLSTLHDGEFFYCSFDDRHHQNLGISTVEPIENKVMPFHIKDIVHACLTLKELAIGLVELAFPETRSMMNEHYRNILGSNDALPNAQRSQEKAVWSQLLKVCVSLLRQLHTRDLRCNFCPPDNWIAPNLNIPLDRPNDLHFSRRRGPRPFQPIRDFTRKNLEEGPPLSTKQIRSIAILKEIPFVVPFNKRFEVLQGLLAAEKLRSQGDQQGFLQGPQIHLLVRRKYLYEDAFDKLSPENEPNLRARFRIQMMNLQGLEEAGIDGGGIFREFLSELLKQAFDPNRGFFILTKDNMLYPNPAAGVVHENFQKHYYFIGRMLGKALFENLLVELPLAEFFLSKLAGRQSNIIDIHQLMSLDPDMHKNLMKLKSYGEGDFSDLGLDFTVVCDDLGDTRVVDLKPDGSNILVNSNNWIEYIQMMADFKLNRQIREQCHWFRQGLANVLPIEWLYMFNTKELQVLISGAEIPVDVDDLRQHTRYGGDYTAEHKTVKIFWKVVQKFDDIQRRQLLKFVTSCSRPPLLGFKDLDPPFCIQNSGDDSERLPSASTCMNLLKLPAFDNEKLLQEKLLYAIQSGVGFELS